MIIQIQDRYFELPNHRLEVTLKHRIQYDVDFGNEINDAIAELDKDEDSPKDKYDEIYYDRCQKTLAFFSNTPLEEVQQLPINDVTLLYESHLKDLIEIPSESEGIQAIEWGGQLYWLPEPVVRSGMFNVAELVNSREICRNMADSNSNKLTSIAFLGVIFLKRKSDTFHESDLDFSSSKFDWIMSLPVDTAMQVAFFYDAWIDYIDNNYSVFAKSKIKSMDLTPHFEKWGWISFLNYVAKNGTMFYRNNGKTNLDNIKDADLHEVLTWASCDKDLEELIAKNLELKEKKNRHQ